MYCFKEKNLRKGSYIYREAVSETDGVYFVVKGQLERIKEDPYKEKEIETINLKHSIRNVIPAFAGRDYGVSLTIVEDNEAIGVEEIIMKKKFR